MIELRLCTDFDKMTYTTYNEFYMKGPRAALGWSNGTEKSNKIKRRVLDRQNSLDVAYVRNVMPTADEAFYLRLLMKHLLARNFHAYLEHTFPGDDAVTQFATSRRCQGTCSGA